MSKEVKICALMRQTWYETAKRNLQPEDRLRFYESIFEYEFEDVAPAEDLPFGARLLFDMVRSDIDADKQRAIERTERNRRNGMQGGRPKLSGENSTTNNRLGYLGFSGNPNTVQNTTVQDTTQQSVNEDTHSRFCIALDFFERGCSTPLVELEKFWGYYAGLGWKTKTGADIVDRIALAKAWQLPDCSAASIKRRAPFADLLHKSGATELCLIGDFVSMVRDLKSKTVTITFLEESTQILFDTKYIRKLWQWFPVDGDGKHYELQYKILQLHLD